MSQALNNIDLTAAQRKEVAALLQRYLPDTEVWAYGSRVKFTAKPHSDLDMVAFAAKEQSQAVADLREAFEESYLPFRVDLFVWDEVPEEFRRNIEEVRVVVQKKKKEYKLPEGWQRISFSDAVHLNPTVKLTKENRYPFVDMKSLNPAYREVVPNEMRTFQSGGARFLPKDTLLARITPCLENGKIARYNPIGTNREAFGSTEFIVIRGKDGVTDNDFVYYLTIWPEFRKFAISQMTGSSGRQRVPVGSLAGFTFNLPPLPEQKAIAHILGSLDDKIELNRRMNETLEAMAQALFKSWFVDFDPVIDNALAAGNAIPDELKEKAAIRQGLDDKRKSLPNDIRRLFPSEFAYTEEMGWIPKGWEGRLLSSVIEQQKQVIKPDQHVNETFEHFSLPAFDEAKWPTLERGTEIKSNKTAIPRGAILVSKLNPRIERVWIPKDVGDRRQICSIEFLCFKPINGFGLATVEALFRSDRMREKMAPMVTGTSNSHQRVPPKVLMQAKMLLPENIARLFENETSPFLGKRQVNRKENQTLSGFRDTLLPKLLSGEIFVTGPGKSQGGL